MEIKTQIDKAWLNAGQAVAYFEFGRRVRRIKIANGDETRAYNGRRRIGGVKTPTVWKRDEEDTIAALAGLVALERFRTISDHKVPFKDIGLGALFMDTEELDAYIKLQHTRAIRIVYNPDTWGAIRVLASNLWLHGELSGQEAYQIWFKERSAGQRIDFSQDALRISEMSNE